MKNKIFINNHQTVEKITPEIKLLIKKCCDFVLLYEKLAFPVEVSVLLTDNKNIKIMNTTFRDKNTETDVLSFPLASDGVYDKNEENGTLIFGDIVISVEKAVEQATLYEHTLEREIAFLTVHSMYHLLGYDHELSDTDAKLMREKEEAVLNELGILREASN